MKKEKLNKLKQTIQDEVFVTKDNTTIYSRNGSLSNWLFDFRAILLQPEYLDLLAELFWEKFEHKYPFQVGGLEVAGIPLISAIVMKSVQKGKPVNGFFIRKSRKKDGLVKMVEGKVTDETIILVDDIINSGKSFLRQLVIIDELNKRVSDIFVILNFKELSSYKHFTEKNIKISSLFSLPDFEIAYIQEKNKINFNTFKVNWKFESQKPNLHYVVPKSAPILDKEKIYFGSDSGIFYALNQKDGSVSWKYKVGWHAKGKSIFSSPILHNNTVYFGSYDGNVYALDSETGKKKWVSMEADWVGSSPDIAPELNLLFIGLEFGLFRKQGGIIALDSETGKKKWDYQMPKYTHSSPLYIPSKKGVVIGSNDGMVYFFNAKNGKLLWNFQTDGEIKESLVYDKKRNLILFGSFDKKLYALNVKDGTIAFTYETKEAIYSTPLVFDGSVFVASLDKRLYKINLDTGEVIWSLSTNGRIFASPIEIDGFIYIGSNDGRLYKIDPEKGKIVGLLQVTERITNKIAHNPDTQKIFLPTFANEIYCIEENVQCVP